MPFARKRIKLRSQKRLPAPLPTGLVSSRGQLVIPQGIRDSIGLQAGSIVVFQPIGKCLLVKSVEIPDELALLAEFESFSAEARRAAHAKGITERSLDDFIHGVKANRNAKNNA